LRAIVVLLVRSPEDSAPRNTADALAAAHARQDVSVVRGSGRFTRFEAYMRNRRASRNPLAMHAGRSGHAAGMQPERRLGREFVVEKVPVSIQSMRASMEVRKPGV
jgi:hypothetical protein